MWYNIDITLSHGCLLNYVLSNRGGGKTYGSLVRMAQNKIKKGSEGIYLRRYKTELKDFVTQFDAMALDPRMKDYLIGVHGRKAYVIKRTDDEEKDEKNLYKKKNVFCIAVALSESVSKKSAVFNKVNLIIFDEFILEKGVTRYLPDEPSMLLGFMETVFRMREDVAVVCMGNKVTMHNPHFVYWGMTKINKNKDFTKDSDNLILVQQFKDSEYIAKKEKTKLGQLQRKSKVGSYIIDNDSLDCDCPFIKKKTPESLHVCSLDINGYHLGVWVDYNKTGEVYISKKVGKEDNRTYAVTLEDRKPNTLFIKMAKQNHHFKMLRYAFENSVLFFETNEVMFACENLYQIIM